jgi:hypothetical protein
MMPTSRVSHGGSAIASHRWMIVLVLLLGAITLILGDMVPANDGLGWDGVMYGKLTRDMFQMIHDGQLNSYYAQRVLPSLLVRGLLDLTGLPLTNPNIIKAFFLYNWVLLLGVCMLWRRVSNHFSLSVTGRWLGFAAIFLNFECAKQSFYYTVLTDVTALFVGMLMLVFYVERRPLPLLITSLIGAFAWQVVGLSGAILLAFMNTALSASAITPVSVLPAVSAPHVIRRISKTWWIVLALSALVVAVVFGGFALFGEEPTLLRTKLLQGVGRFATGAPSLLAAFIGLAMLVNSRAFIAEVLVGIRRTNKLPVAFAIAAIVIPALVVRAISNPLVPNPSGMGLVAWLMLLPPNGKILLSLVTNFVFWGPMVIVLLLKWDAFCVEARRLGPGFVFVIGLSLLLCLVTEPRFITSAWPFFVLGGVLVMEKQTGRQFLIVFGVLTLLLAQFWLKINFEPWVGPADDNLKSFPKQLYFMHYGLWMSWPTFAVQLLLAGITIVLMKKSLEPKSH